MTWPSAANIMVQIVILARLVEPSVHKEVTDMNSYEVILMFYPDAESEKREKQYERLKGIIAGAGEIKSEDEWGMRKLAYEIEDYKEAYYILVEFDADPGIIKEFSRIASISDTVMREMVVRVDE